MLKYGIGLIVAMFLPYVFRFPITPNESFAAMGICSFLGYLIGLLVGLVSHDLKKCPSSSVSGPK